VRGTITAGRTQTLLKSERMLPKLSEECEDIRETNDDVIGSDAAAENERFLSTAPPTAEFDGVNGNCIILVVACVTAS
jgi:hypothetical protein